MAADYLLPDPRGQRVPAASADWPPAAPNWPEPPHVPPPAGGVSGLTIPTIPSVPSPTKEAWLYPAAGAKPGSPSTPVHRGYWPGRHGLSYQDLLIGESSRCCPTSPSASPRGALAVVVPRPPRSPVPTALFDRQRSSSGGERLGSGSEAPRSPTRPRPRRQGRPTADRPTPASGHRAQRQRLQPLPGRRHPERRPRRLRSAGPRPAAPCGCRRGARGQTPNKPRLLPAAERGSAHTGRPRVTSVVELQRQGNRPRSASSSRTPSTRFTNSPDVKVEWAPYRRASRPGTGGCLPRARTEPVTLAFATMWRTTGEPGDRIACSAEAAGRRRVPAPADTISETLARDDEKLRALDPFADLVQLRVRGRAVHPRRRRAGRTSRPPPRARARASHAASASGPGRITGIRSCTLATTSFGSVVTIVQL